MTKTINDNTFWNKAQRFAKSAGKQLLQKALWLYYTAKSPNTPAWARRVIYGALAYFVLPLDGIPDVLPVMGFSDDLAALSAAVATVSVFITKEIKAEADKKLMQWFN